jgi:hypothetical protein
MKPPPEARFFLGANMFARKLGRLAGLVFMLVALVGGGAATVSAEHSAGGSIVEAAQFAQQGDIVWE